MSNLTFIFLTMHFALIKNENVNIINWSLYLLPNVDIDEMLSSAQIITANLEITS